MTEYEIFMNCFPDFRLTERQFQELSGLENCTLFRDENGFAAVYGNAVRLLCVLPDKRGNGIGSSLLVRAEDHIRDHGYPRAALGGTSSRLLIGTPVECAEFFKKRGYTLTDRVAEMYGTPYTLGSAPQAAAEFGFCKGSALEQAVAAVDPDWVQYFGDGEIFCGTVREEIASFCIIEDDVDCIFSDSSRFGSIGCVGTVPEYRRRGIGLKMVELAARELYSRGCEKIFIHYTGVYDWYAKLGFRTGLMLFLGDKQL